MFSLIIVIIAIALVAALAAATIYYGGQAFRKSGATADAAKLLTQSQQILGAMELYRADHGAYPSKAQLTAPDASGKIYLRSWPTAAAPSAAPTQGALATATAAAALEWRMIDGVPLVWLQGRQQDVCSAFNQASRGDDGIMKKLSSRYLSQCWAPPGDDFTAVVGKVVDTDTLTQVTGDVSLVTELGAPVSTPSDPLWHLAPQKKASSGSGGSGDSGGGGPGEPSDPGASSPGSGGGTPGSGVATAVVSQEDYTFPPLPAGDASFSRVFTLTNTSQVSLAVYGASVSGEGFSAQSDCRAVLAAGTSCSTLVSFQSPNGGTFSGSLSFATNAVPSVPLVTLSATSLKSQLELSALHVPFGLQPVDAQVESGQLTLINKGNTAALNLSLGVLPTGFSIVNSTCPSSLAAAQSCTFSVRFSAAPGMTTPGGPVRITSRDSGVQYGVSAAVEQGPEGPPVIDFGTHVVGSRTLRTLNVRNDSAQTITVGSVTSSDPINYLVSADCAGPLGPGDACPVSVTFAPSAAGASSLASTLTVVSSGPASPFTFNLTGAARAPKAFAANEAAHSWRPLAALDLGDVQVNSSTAGNIYFLTDTSAPTSVDAVITGDSRFTIVGIYRYWSMHDSDARVESCGATLAGPAALGCVTTTTHPKVGVAVRFEPAGQAGQATAALQLSYSDEGLAQTTAPVPLAATGQAQGTLSASSAGGSLPFAATAAGSTGPVPYVLRVTSAGAGALRFDSVAVTGPYLISANSCPSAGSALPVGQSCDITVSFSPSVVSPTNEGALSVTTNDASGPYSLALSGVSTLPMTLLAPAEQNLGAVVPGTNATATHLFAPSGAVTATTASVGLASASQNFTISAVRKATADGSSSAACGAVIGSPARAASGCRTDATYPAVLVEVTYSSPSAALAIAEESASVTLTYDAGAGPVTTSPVATRAAPALAIGSLAPSPGNSDAFGNVGVGSEKTLSYTFANTGNRVATGVYAQVSGSDLTIPTGANSCGTSGSPVSVAAGASCTVSVRYAPTSGSDLGAGLLTVVSSGLGSPNQLALTGAGADPLFSSVRLLAQASGGTIADKSSSPAALTANSGVSVDSAIARFAGTSSMKFTSNSGGVIVSPYTASRFDLAATMTEWTLEAWVYFQGAPSSIGTYRLDVLGNQGGSNGWEAAVGTGGTSIAVVYPGVGGIGVATGQLVAGRWYHFVWQRKGSTYTFGVDGQIKHVGAYGGGNPNSFLRIGGNYAGNVGIVYNIQDLRLTAAARYPATVNATYVLPAGPYPSR